MVPLGDREMSKTAMATRIAELEKQLFVAQASQIYRAHFASAYLDKISTAKLTGSGVILSIHTIKGDQVFEPVLIANGLAPETIAALQADLARSFNYRTEMKPKGAKP